MTNEILTQEEFERTLGAVIADFSIPNAEMLRTSHSAALAHIAELDSEITGLVTRILEKDRRIEKMESSQPVQLIDAHMTPNSVEGSWAVDPEIAKAFVMDMAALFAETGADNYLEYTLRSRSCSDQFQVLIQKKAGQTPAEQNTELRAKIAELEAAQRWNSPSERPKNDEDIYWMEREFEARNGTIIRDGYYNEMTDAAYCFDDRILPSKIEWSSVLGWLRYTDLQDSFPETLLKETKS